MSQLNKKCPYFDSRECGNPDKEHTMRCNDGTHGGCFSYISIERCKERKDEEKDGKQDA